MKRVKKSKTYDTPKSSGDKGSQIGRNIRNLRTMVRSYTTGEVRFDRRKKAFNEILDYEKKVRKALSKLSKKDRILYESEIDTFLHQDYKEHVKWILKDEK